MERAFWISATFKGATVSFPNGTTWKLTQVLSEKSTRNDIWDEGEDGQLEASAVFACTQTRGKSSPQAIIRIRMQIPTWVDSFQPDPAVRARKASSNLSGYAEMERLVLQRMTEKKCPYTPKLLSINRTVQDSKSWVPGGWLIMFLMEKLPGKSPFKIFDANQPNYESPEARSERDEIRQAFKKALTALYEARLDYGDPGLRNLLWDADTKTCYIIDFEDWYDIAHRPRQVLKFFSSNWREWGLSD